MALYSFVFSSGTDNLDVASQVPIAPTAKGSRVADKDRSAGGPVDGEEVAVEGVI